MRITLRTVGRWILASFVAAVARAIASPPSDPRPLIELAIAIASGVWFWRGEWKAGRVSTYGLKWVTGIMIVSFVVLFLIGFVEGWQEVMEAQS